ncbi:MAG: hypothetical protein V9G20_10910 [Candidatus Promineifilaceae bacterium]
MYLISQPEKTQRVGVIVDAFDQESIIFTGPKIGTAHPFFGRIDQHGQAIKGHRQFDVGDAIAGTCGRFAFFDGA